MIYGWLMQLISSAQFMAKYWTIWLTVKSYVALNFFDSRQNPALSACRQSGGVL